MLLMCRAEMPLDVSPLLSPAECGSKAGVQKCLVPDLLNVLLAAGVAGYAMYGNKTLEEVTLNLHAGPLQLAATSLILVSPFTKFALTLEPVARGTEQFLQQVRVSSWSHTWQRYANDICVACCMLHAMWTKTDVQQMTGSLCTVQGAPLAHLSRCL